MTRSRRSIFGTVLVAMMAAGSASPVAGMEPPANDDPGDATTLPSALPQLVLQDARAATASPSEACGVVRTSIWFAFIPDRDEVVSIEPLAGVLASGAVYREAADPAHLQTCIHGATKVAMLGHARYVLMFGGVAGSDAPIAIRLGRDPRQVRVSIDPLARLGPDGMVSVSGSATCDVPEGIGGLTATIAQPAIRPRAMARASTGAICSADRLPWSVSVAPGDLPFRFGALQVTVEASMCDGRWCMATRVVGTVQVVARPSVGPVRHLPFRMLPR